MGEATGGGNLFLLLLLGQVGYYHAEQCVRSLPENVSGGEDGNAVVVGFDGREFDLGRTIERMLVNGIEAIASSSGRIRRWSNDDMFELAANDVGKRTIRVEDGAIGADGDRTFFHALDEYWMGGIGARKREDLVAMRSG